uniref:Uncharacterized protein n=1 Tax=Candidatus Kentrum eta TaxID=2126337 RepID=A0A450VM92_9GAMM|nr:MAG: hypothetical protein BECKH772B_GA0070898_105712 [Candidatus Kentron sp. H]VFK05924.1 MAG: hypothetical protein BECKH772A_GA0070896_106002 [Candidatus Kentron sp. H]VFK09326.1 MAG: hypothetical protein BECKH772C_GA0070978_105972 [Candidatus Kentron sp. H]
MARFKTPNDPHYEKPPTLTLWVIGIYVALYGVASTNYEAALDRAENRMGALASQLATPDEAAFKSLIEQIPRIQGMETPPAPSLLWPFRGHFAPVSLFLQEKNPGPAVDPGDRGGLEEAACGGEPSGRRPFRGAASGSQPRRGVARGSQPPRGAAWGSRQPPKRCGLKVRSGT